VEPYLFYPYMPSYRRDGLKPFFVSGILKASQGVKMLFEIVRCVFYYLCLEASPGKSELLQDQYELNKKF
jgi:hypothetical protein